MANPAERRPPPAALSLLALSAVLLYTGAPPPVSVAHAPSIGASSLVSRSRATPIGVPYHQPTLAVAVTAPRAQLALEREHAQARMARARSRR